jgi:glycosyltransferase involved in cell wall biosynthesis
MCPALHSQKENDISRRIWKHKQKYWTPDLFTIVAPSQWLADCVKSSSLLQNFKAEVIPNPIDTKIFQPIDKEIARKILHLPQNKRLILFGAGDILDLNKGLDLLLAALHQFDETEGIELVVFGAGKTHRLSAPVLLHSEGVIRDERFLALLYNAADVVVVPSRQENLNNTVMEALSCGTPCVAFNIGGMSDMIDHQQNGYLAEPFANEDLANGIRWVLHEADIPLVSHYAREKVQTHFSMDVVAKQYIELYQRVLSNP